MEKIKINKIILHSSLCLFIINIVIIYGIFFQSYINKDKINQYTGFPWYTDILLISVILSLPTLIFGLIYLHSHKKIYSKFPSVVYLIASFIFIFTMILGAIECFIGKIPFSIITLLFLIAFVFFIISFIKNIFYKLLKVMS